MLRRVRAGTFALSAAVLLCMLGTQTFASKLTAHCDRSQVAETVSEVRCDVRGVTPGEFEKFVVTLEDGKPVDVLGYDPFNFKLHKSAYLFLIQSSGHPRDASAAVGQLLALEGSKRAAGLYTFADKIAEHAKLGSSESDIRAALANTRTKVDKGSRTSLYGALRSAARALGKFDADRKAIVLFSDGSSVESYTEKDALEAARDNNVAIYAIAMTGASEGSANLVTLRRLAEATDGAFVDAGSVDPHPLPGAFAARFLDYLENGGQLRLRTSQVPADASVVIQANLVGAEEGAAPLKSSPAAVGVDTGPKEDTILETAKSTYEEAVEWVAENPIPAAASGIIALGLLIFGYTAARRRRVPAPIQGAAAEGDDDFLRTSQYGRSGDPTAVASASDTVILTPMNDKGAPANIYAWLQFLDATSTRVPIGATNVRIGRHKDNDICLQNKSVHRQHAVLHKSHDGKFVIRDLGTTNGVIVNSQRISQKELSDGDLIELGEVRARFFANPEATL